jgi:hypothetical protein
MPYAVISPVGVSLFQRAYGERFQAQVRRLREEGGSEKGSAWDEVLRDLRDHLRQSEQAGRAEESCAEIKSLLTLVRSRGEEQPALLYLLPTETAESRACG